MEYEAKETAKKLERITQTNVETILADARNQYERVRAVTRTAVERLAALELMIREVRTQVPPELLKDFREVMASPIGATAEELEPERDAESTQPARRRRASAAGVEGSGSKRVTVSARRQHANRASAR
jgi:hypothetical protein